MSPKSRTTMTSNLPKISAYFRTKGPSAVRLSQIEFSKRTDGVQAVNVGIGNVSLPMPAVMQKRMGELLKKGAPFENGVVRYSESIGLPETNKAFLNIIKALGFETEGIYSQITDGGSLAMELMILGICGPAASKEKPLLVFDPAYSNYIDMAERVGRRIVAVPRRLEEDGLFSMPPKEKIEEIIKKYQPGGVLVIPADNPSGQHLDFEKLKEVAQLCVKYNLWLASDEAYLGLNYDGKNPTSVWALTEEDVPGITGRRMAIMSASKILNGCGLRVGWFGTDNEKFHEQFLYAYTPNLCANAPGQYIVGALAELKPEDVRKWLEEQRNYYRPILAGLRESFLKENPKLVVSRPDASIYMVVDMRNAVEPDFDSQDFAMYCAREGKVEIDDQKETLLFAPMRGFYNPLKDEDNPGRFQVRLSCVETPDNMAKVPYLFTRLLEQYKESLAS